MMTHFGNWLARRRCQYDISLIHEFAHTNNSVITNSDTLVFSIPTVNRNAIGWLNKFHTFPFHRLLCKDIVICAFCKVF